MSVLKAPPLTHRHLRARDGGAQETTTVELFFALVYVLAVTQLSHLLLTHLTWTSLRHMSFLLLVVWWAWIYTTWMANWLEQLGETFAASRSSSRARRASPWSIRTAQRDKLPEPPLGLSQAGG